MPTFIDIETLPALDWTNDQIEAHAEQMVPKNIKKPETIARWVAENKEELWRKTALDWRYCRVLCVGIADGGAPAECIWGETEAETLEGLEQALSVADTLPTVTHNGATFDLPVLWRRGLKYGLRRLPSRLYQAKPWNSAHFVDTCQLFSAPESRPIRGSGLTDVAGWLGIERSGNPIDGSQVYERWADGDFEAIKAHVLDDINTLREVYNRLCADGLR